MALHEKTEDWLLPYLEGAYADDAPRLTEIEARLAADPALSAEAARMRQMLDTVRGVAARTPRPAAAAVPADSWPRLKARLQSQSSQAAPRRTLSWGWLGGGGAAVAVAAGVLAVILPGHHAPLTASGPPLRTASRPAPKVSPAAPSAAKTAQTPAQVAQTAPVPTPTGPLAKPNPNGLSDPFLTLPVPPPLPGKAAGKTPSSVATKPEPRLNQQMASRDILNDRIAPEVVRPLLPLPVAPAPAAPLLPVPPPVVAAAPPASQARVERRMLKMSPLASASSRAATGQVQAFGTEAAPGAPSPTADALNQAAPPAAAFGGGGGFGGGAGGFGGGGVDRAQSLSLKRMAVPSVTPPLSADSAARLTAAQAALTEAVTSPLWGKNAGIQQVSETLTGAQESGLLDDLRAKLEARRTQMPKDLATGRMLAAVYDFSGTADAALHERQRAASLDGADGEDFFQLGQSEQRAGNVDAARAAFRRALTAPTPPSGFHAALARQGAQ